MNIWYNILHSIIVHLLQVELWQSDIYIFNSVALLECILVLEYKCALTLHIICLGVIKSIFLSWTINESDLRFGQWKFKIKHRKFRRDYQKSAHVKQYKTILIKQLSWYKSCERFQSIPTGRRFTLKATEHYYSCNNYYSCNSYYSCNKNLASWCMSVA